MSNSKGLLSSVVCVSSNEVLQQQFRVGEVASVVLKRLTVSAHKSFLEVGTVPNPTLHFVGVEELLTLFDELVSTHLHILVEEVAAEDLFAVLVVDGVGGGEEEHKHSLGWELHILVVEEDIVVVEEDEGRSRAEHSKAFKEGIVNIQVSHIVVPLWIVRVQKHGVEGEFRSNTFGNIE